MRIQVNKLCAEPSKEVYQFLRKADKYITHNKALYGTDNGVTVWCDVEGCVCEKCGAELYGIWHTYELFFTYASPEYYDKDKETPSYIIEEGKRIRAELEKQKKAAQTEMDAKFVCPICGKENEYRHSGLGKTDDEKVANVFKKAYDSLQHKFGYTAQLDVIHSSSQCNSLVSNSTFSNISVIKADPEQLKQYIFNLIKMESNITLLKKRLEVLYGERYMAMLDVSRVNYEPVAKAKEQKKSLQKQYDEAVKRYRDRTEQLESCKSDPPEIIDIPMLTEPAEPQLVRPGLFNKKKVLEHNENLKAQYEKDLKKYEQKCRERLAAIERKTKEANRKHQTAVQDAEKALQKAKAEMDQLRGRLNSCTPGKAIEVCPEKAKLAMLEDEIGNTLELLTKTYEARNTLYAANIVFEKYRDIVALSTFYEYLMAGRCTSLEGSSGAYNLYEMESRANMIITQLAQIEKSLQKIRQTQYMICDQLSAMNYALDRMNSTMDAAYEAITDIRANTTDMNTYMANISKNSNVIAHNSTVTAYYSKVNAELTNALGFMLALK